MASISPTFFIVGAPKAGTTSLYRYLEEHPDVFMSHIKETNFFSFEEIKAQGLYYHEEHISTLEEYNRLFAKVSNEKAIGEASVSYLFYDTVPKKIYEFNPEAKIIMVLRNPVDRGYSHYLMDKRMGLVKKPYEGIVNSDRNTQKDRLYYQQYVELGQYYEQVKRYLHIFAPEQVKIIFFEELRNNPSQLITDIYNFLNVDITFRPDVDRKHNTFKKPKNNVIKALYQNSRVRKAAGRLTPGIVKNKLQEKLFNREDKLVLTNSLRMSLQEIYQDDIIQLEKLLDVNLSHWFKAS